ncbi:unnamed protein product [Spodoptera exigua]|nr:unnamed protein product [Spodoptera exigua]
MKFCIPKELFTQCNSTIGDCQACVIRFFMSAVDFYLSMAGNCLVVLGYLFGKVFCEDYNPCLLASVLILFGHFLALISDTCSVIEDILYFQHMRRDFSVNRFFVFANILSIIGEYQELKKSLRNTNAMATG